MKKISLYLFLFCTILSLVSAFYFLQGEITAAKKTYHEKEEAIKLSSSPSYYMKLQGGTVIIYNMDHTIYEFTDLEQNDLPYHLILELLEGKYFEGPEELYEFLETYTS